MGGLENRNGIRLKSIAVFLYQVLFGMALLSFFNCKGFGVAGNALAVSVQEFLVVPMLLASGKGEAMSKSYITDAENTGDEIGNRR